MTSAPEASSGASKTRWALLGAAAVALLVAGRQLPLETWLASFEASVAALGAWGPAAFALLYTLAALLLLPGAALTLAAGALFGVALGTLTAWIAAPAAAAGAFLLARHGARNKVAERARNHPRFGAIDRAIGERGWKIVALLRLSPAIPFSLSNYLYGLTSIRFVPYLVTSALAMLPGTFLYVSFGAAAARGVESAAGGASETSLLEWGLRAAGLLATLGTVLYAAAIARRALRDTAGIGDDPDEGAQA